MNLSNRNRRGMTLVELMVSMGIMMLLTLFLFGIGLHASQVIRKTDDSSSVMAKTRLAYQQLSQHMSEADAILTQYPPTGTAVYRSDTTSTIILRVPVPNSSGVVLPGRYDVFIYRIEAATRDSGPNILKRYRGTITNNVSAAAVLDRNLAARITTFALDYGTTETFLGDQSRKQFTLSATPLAGSTEIPTLVMVGGTNRLADNMASLSGPNVNFALAPRSNIPIDAHYRVNPQTPVDAFGRSGAKYANVRVICRTTWKTRNSDNRNRDIELNSRMTLRD
jgi:type II secretory pathway pseudopilin PulG